MQQRLTVSIRWMLVALVLVITLGFPHTNPTAQAYQGGNLLQNPGFEQAFIAINGDATLRVGTSWQPWSLPPDTSSSSINARPEYKPAPANRVRSGSSAQEYNTFFATHTGGVYQRVPVTPGTQLRFSLFVYVWSSASFANPDVSDDPNDVLVRVGIDPAGGTDGTSPNIVWSSDTEFYDQYRELSVNATAQGNAVTVFVRSAPQGFVGTTNVYLDDASLLPLGTEPVATATIPPTDIFAPTQEGTLTPVPTSAVTTIPLPTFTTVPFPTATPGLPSGFDSSITYTVRSGDTVSALAQRYGSTVDAIAKANGLSNAGLIFVGQTLVIPVKSGTTQPATLTPVPTLPSTGPTAVPSGGSYTVRGGDTLYALAIQFNTTVAALAQLNNIVNPNLIYPGQVLVVPGSTVPTPTPKTPTPVPPSTTPGTHVVQPGENLFRISLRYNVALDALARANGIWNVNLIYVGQVLIIPR